MPAKGEYLLLTSFVHDNNIYNPPPTPDSDVLKQTKRNVLTLASSRNFLSTVRPHISLASSQRIHCIIPASSASIAHCHISVGAGYTPYRQTRSLVTRPMCPSLLPPSTDVPTNLSGRAVTFKRGQCVRLSQKHVSVRFHCATPPIYLDTDVGLLFPARLRCGFARVSGR